MSVIITVLFKTCTTLQYCTASSLQSGLIHTLYLLACISRDSSSTSRRPSFSSYVTGQVHLLLMAQDWSWSDLMAHLRHFHMWKHDPKAW